MKRTALVGALLALMGSGSALADMNYTNLQVSYLDVEVGQGVDVDGDGFEIGGAYELSDKIHVFGTWQDQSLDFGIDGRSLELGGGWTHSFTDDLDFVGTLSYVDAELEQGGFSADDDGLGLGAGVRARLADSFELDARVKYVDFDESGSDTGFSVGGRYYLNDAMALAASADFNDNADTLRLGFRWEF